MSQATSAGVTSCMMHVGCFGVYLIVMHLFVCSSEAESVTAVQHCSVDSPCPEQDVSQ